MNTCVISLWFEYSSYKYPKGRFQLSGYLMIHIYFIILIQTGSQCMLQKIEVRVQWDRFLHMNQWTITLNQTQEPKLVVSVHWPLTHLIYSVENVLVNIVLGINGKGGARGLVIVFEKKVLESHSVLLLEGHHYLVAEAEHHQLQQRREALIIREEVRITEVCQHL